MSGKMALDYDSGAFIMYLYDKNGALLDTYEVSELEFAISPEAYLRLLWYFGEQENIQ